MILDVLKRDRNILIYRPELNQITGSVTATILLQQIIYRYDNKSFYKFRAPCEHSLYKPGDSWIEELGFTIYEFDNALSKISTKVKKGDDLTKIKTPIYHWTTIDRTTYYAVNIQVLTNLLESVYVNEESAFTKEDKLDLHVNEESAFTKSNFSDLQYITETTTENKNTSYIPQTPKAASNLIVGESVGLPKGLNLKIESSEQSQEMAIEAWMSIIKEQQIEFTNFELKAIKHRARTFPRKQGYEMLNEIILLEKWALEGMDIENALRSDYKNLATYRPTLRVEVDKFNKKRIYEIDRLNDIRQNTINKEKDGAA
jgi:hypothetical protein